MQIKKLDNLRFCMIFKEKLLMMIHDVGHNNSLKFMN